MSTPDLYSELTCPMADCDEVLFLDWTASMPLIMGHLTEAKTPLFVSDADFTMWRIQCATGHVVLLPGQPGCPCDDPGGEGCPHNESPAADDFDWNEEVRTFTRHDAERLRKMLNVDLVQVGAR